MGNSFRSRWLSIKGSYWFIPSVLSLLAFLLSIATIWFDRHGGSEWLTFLDWYEPSRPDGARAQLTVIASAMIAIASTVFAITIAAVAYASGNYGPRLLTNFMNDRGNQISLGVFIATFVYNLMVLRVVRDPQGGPTDVLEAAAFVPQVSVLISMVMAIFAVCVLVYFLHHIPASIRINTVLAGIGRRLVRDIENRFELKFTGDEPAEPKAGEPLTATAIGYVKIIDFKDLDEIAEEEGIVISLKVRTGDFVHPHLLVAETDKAVSGDAAAKIRDCFSVGDSRTSTQDLEFLIDELVEISLRALSPGINDPFTAITGLHWMSAALATLAERDLSAGPEQHRYDGRRIRPMPDDFEHFLRRSFGGIRASAATSPAAAKMYIDALCGVAVSTTSPNRRRALAKEGRLLLCQAETSLAGPALDELRDRYREFERRVPGSNE